VPTEYGEKFYPTLYVKFDKQHFPRGAFCYLAACFMKEGWNIQHEYPYSNVMIFQNPDNEHQYAGLFENKTELAVDVYQNEKNIPIIKISELIYQSLSKFCEKICIKCNFNFAFTCNKRNCKLFASVVLQYPYSTIKYCKKSGNSTLQHDEMAWLITQDIVKIMNPMVCTYVKSYLLLCINYVYVTGPKKTEHVCMHDEMYA